MNGPDARVLNALTQPMSREGIENITGLSGSQIALSLETLEALGLVRHCTRNGSLVLLFEKTARQ